MNVNENVIKGKWTEIKGDLQKSWGKLTNDELEKTKGDIKAIQGLLQQRYGQAEETFSKKVSDIFEKFRNEKDEVVSSVKKNIKA
jgi:uncharacterized protein YjbJ (UPF0337 family)